MERIEQEKGQIRRCPRDGADLEVQAMVGGEGDRWRVYMACPSCDAEYFEDAQMGGGASE